MCDDKFGKITSSMSIDNDIIICRADILSHSEDRLAKSHFKSYASLSAES